MNVCIKKWKRKFTKRINIINNKRKDKNLLNAIEYHYYNNSYNKSEDKADKKGLKLIKERIMKIYIKMDIYI